MIRCRGARVIKRTTDGADAAGNHRGRAGDVRARGGLGDGLRGERGSCPARPAAVPAGDVALTVSV